MAGELYAHGPYTARVRGAEASGRSGTEAIGLATLAALPVLTFMILLGATGLSERSPAFAIISVALSIPFIAVSVARGPASADRTDKLVLVALLLFIAACLLSSIPRLSFEPALAALAYAAALFVGRGLFTSPTRRSAFMWTLIALSVVITAMTASRWAAYLLEWMSVASFRVLPPLNMELPAFPWGHRHDLALLITMLYPAWWLGQLSPIRRVLAVAMGLVVAVLVIVDGSRTLWVAIIAASVALGVMIGAKRGNTPPRLTRRTAMILLAVAIALIGVAAISGAASAVLQRVTNFESVGFRTAMWSSLVESWLAHPAAGSGPGTFPWVLQGTGYFDTTSFAPRHPDSAPIQALAEAGLLGIVAMALVIVAVAPSLIRHGQQAALWAVIAFGVASVASNPTDFGFMVLIATAWAAYGLPRPLTDGRPPSPPWLVGSRLGALGVIGAAWLLTWLGAVAYGEARGAVGAGDYGRATRALERAAALDPGMPLYARELGTLRYVTGDGRMAADQLRTAVELNPHDDVAWRTLATVEGGGDRAAAAINRAVDAQRSDPSNLLLYADAALEQGRTPEARTVLAEVVQAWPTVVFASEWDHLIADAPFGTNEVVADAARRWIEGLPAPEMVEDHGLWLLSMSGMSEHTDRAVAESGYTRRMANAMIALMSCEPATAILRNATASDLQTIMYWQLRLRDASVRSTPDPAAEWMVEYFPRLRLAVDPLNPLQDTSVRGFIPDLWGYRRIGIPWPETDNPLPSPSAGLTSWLRATDCAH